MLLLLSSTTASMVTLPFDGASGSVARTGNPFSRASGGRVATAIAEDDTKSRVVEDSQTFNTVSELNQLSLSHFRCHDISADTAPDVDPFAMVADDISRLNAEVCGEVTGKDEVLTASSQHFFGAGNTREGKRVRPVLVCLMGQVRSI